MCKNQKILDSSDIFSSHFYSLALPWMATRRQPCPLPVDWSHGACGWLDVRGLVCAQACVFICVGTRRSKQCQIETVMCCNTGPAPCASASNQRVSVKLPPDAGKARAFSHDPRSLSPSLFSFVKHECICGRDETCSSCSGPQGCVCHPYLTS